LVQNYWLGLNYFEVSS